jgi:hypothetical protein
MTHKWPLSRWNADGSPNTAATLDDYEAREELVQEVIRLSKARDELSPYAHKLKDHYASLLQVAARKLAGWKP